MGKENESKVDIDVVWVMTWYDPKEADNIKHCLAPL